MEKKNVVFLTVLAIATLLTAVVGTTFAYFSASLTSDGINGTNVNVTSKTVPQVTVVSSGSGTNGQILPGWKGYEYATVTAGAGDTPAYYNLSITHNFAKGEDAQTAATSHIADYVIVNACEVASYDPDGYAAGSLVSTTSNGQTIYYFEGASVVAPTCLNGSSFTAISNDELENHGTITFATNKAIQPSSSHVYVVTYEFAQSSDITGVDHNAAMGETFGATWASTLAAGAVNPQP